LTTGLSTTFVVTIQLSCRTKRMRVNSS
jgi:hypothetical protein